MQQKPPLSVLKKTETLLLRKEKTTYTQNTACRKPPVPANAAVMSQVNNLINAMAVFAPETGSSSMLPTNQYDPNAVLLGASAA